MMNDPRHIQIRNYNYPLPDERIAKYPLAHRDESKLLLRAKDGTVSETVFKQLPDYLPAGALMVFNNTKVIQARLHFHKSTGALIEIFCLEPHTPLDYQQSFATTGSVTWTCLVGNLKKWKEGALEREIALRDRNITLRAERIGVSGTGFVIRFSWNDDSVSWAEVLDAIGELPIPPYLNRETEESDLKTYQTVYSKIKGSVAAPTAGLHFTPEVLGALDAKGIERAELTLHVGAGTFKPVKSEEIEGHTMHSEWIAVRREIIERLIAHGGRCIAVGTTSVRTLESLYYIGLIIERLVAEGRTLTDIHAEDLHVPQWMPYDTPTKEKPAEEVVSSLTRSEETEGGDSVKSLEWILRYLDANHYTTLSTSTQIIIAPGYSYHIVRTIVTNFHQPQSTLLLLVSAFVGGEWRPIYDYALAHDFRFLSYGDSSVLNYDAIKLGPTERRQEANTVDEKPTESVVSTLTRSGETEKGDNSQELLPVVDEAGNVVGQTTRGTAHNGVDKPLHPVVHLHVFNSAGELFLQHRPVWKDIQPDRWDTAVGGHVDWGEDIPTALRREVREEIGLTCDGAEFLTRYVFESPRERELVNVFRLLTDASPCPTAELDGGRFFSPSEISQRLGTGFFTPNFEQEYQRVFCNSED